MTTCRDHAGQSRSPYNTVIQTQRVLTPLSLTINAGPRKPCCNKSKTLAPYITMNTKHEHQAKHIIRVGGGGENEIGKVINIAIVVVSTSSLFPITHFHIA